MEAGKRRRKGSLLPDLSFLFILIDIFDECVFYIENTNLSKPEKMVE